MMQKKNEKPFRIISSSLSQELRYSDDIFNISNNRIIDFVGFHNFMKIPIRSFIPHYCQGDKSSWTGSWSMSWTIEMVQIAGTGFFPTLIDGS